MVVTDNAFAETRQRRTCQNQQQRALLLLLAEMDALMARLASNPGSSLMGVFADEDDHEAEQRHRDAGRVLCHVENKVNPATGEKTCYKTYWVPAAASSALQCPSSDTLFSIVQIPSLNPSSVATQGSSAVVSPADSTSASTARSTDSTSSSSSSAVPSSKARPTPATSSGTSSAAIESAVLAPDDGSSSTSSTAGGSLQFKRGFLAKPRSRHTTAVLGKKSSEPRRATAAEMRADEGSSSTECATAAAGAAANPRSSLTATSSTSADSCTALEVLAQTGWFSLTSAAAERAAAGPAGVLSAHDLQSLQPVLAAWLQQLQAQRACTLQKPVATTPAPETAGVTVSTGSKAAPASGLMMSSASAQDCACQQHRMVMMHWNQQQKVSALNAVLLSGVTPVSSSSATHSSEDPATVGSAAQQLMDLALQVVQGGHSLQALEVVTRCFEELVNGVRASQSDSVTQQLRVSLAAAHSGWPGELHGLLKSLAADPELKPYGSVAMNTENASMEAAASLLAEGLFSSQTPRPDAEQGVQSDTLAAPDSVAVDDGSSSAADGGRSSAADGGGCGGSAADGGSSSAVDGGSSSAADGGSSSAAGGGSSSADNGTPSLLRYAPAAFRWAAALQRVWPGPALAASKAGPVIATAAEAAAAVLQRAVETRSLLAGDAGAATAAVSSGSSTSAAGQLESAETAACVAAYQLLSQLTLELGDMLEKNFQRQQATGYEWLESLAASASRLMHSTEAMLHLCSWVLAVEGSRLVQLLCLDTDQLSGMFRRTAADSAADNTVAPQDTMPMGSHSSASARHASSTPGVFCSVASHSSHPASVSVQHGPISSLQHAEGLLLHNADVLAALLRSIAPTTEGAASQRHAKAASAAASALAGPTLGQQEHMQHLVSSLVRSLRQAVQQQQAVLAVPDSFLAAAGAASAAAVSSTVQQVPGGPKHRSPACIQLLTAVSRLLKGLVQVCLQQYGSFLSQGMTNWLFSSAIESMPLTARSAAQASHWLDSVDEASGETAGSNGGSSAGSSAGNSTSRASSRAGISPRRPGSAGRIAAPDSTSAAAARPQHETTGVRPPERMSNMLQLLVCAAGASLTLINSGNTSTAAAAEALQLSGSLLEAAELLLELPVTLQCNTARMVMQLGGDKAAIADSFEKLWARSSQLPGTRKHAQQLLLSVGASVQQAPAGMQLLWHAACTTSLLVSIPSSTPAFGRPSSSQGSVTAVLGQVCALHRGQCSDTLRTAMEQRKGGGSLLAMLLDSQLRLAMETGSQQHLQQLAFAVQVLEAATRSTLDYIWRAEAAARSAAGSTQQPSSSSRNSSSGRGSSGSTRSRSRGGGRSSVSNQPHATAQQALSAAAERCALFVGVEHSIMRPVAHTAAEAFATAAATAASAAAAGNTGSSSPTAGAAGVAANKEVSLFSSRDGQMLLQALLSFSLTVSKACAGLTGWQWYNFAEKPGAETSPLLLANMALLGVQSQLAVAEELHTRTRTPSADSSAASDSIALQDTSSSSCCSSGDGGGFGDGGSSATGSSCSNVCSSGSGCGGSNVTTTTSGSSSDGNQSFSAAPWQQLLCAAAFLTSKMLHVEAGAVSHAGTLAAGRSPPTAAVTLPTEWLCGNIFRVQAADNKALALLQQYASQLALLIEASAVGGATGGGGPGSLLWQVQLTCSLLQGWCNCISKQSSSRSLQQQQQQSLQQQQQQQLVKGLQVAVRVLSDQLVPALTELHKLIEQSLSHRCDLNSNDPVQTSNLSTALSSLFSTASGPYAPSEEDRRRGKAILIAFSGVAAALKAASKALAAAVPCSYACNYWGCRNVEVNLRTVSEGFALVRGKGCVCGGCLGVDKDCSVAPAGSQSLMAARYCSRECQAAHRQQHKELCHRLGQAASSPASNTTEPSDQ